MKIYKSCTFLFLIFLIPLLKIEAQENAYLDSSEYQNSFFREKIPQSSQQKTTKDYRSKYSPVPSRYIFSNKPLPYSHSKNYPEDIFTNPFSIPGLIPPIENWTTGMNDSKPASFASSNPILGVREDWVQTFESNLLASTDVAVDVAVDREGNIYVTGYTTNLPNGVDFYTIKYDSDGNEIWARFYNSGVNNDDMAKKIAVDTSGNVFVAGEVIGPDGSWDIVLIKYNTNGDEEWFSRFLSSASERSDEYLTDMVLDKQGNIFMSGYTNYADKYIIVKYDQEGQQQWSYINDFLKGAEQNIGNSLAVDKQGNVFMFGGCKQVKDYIEKDYNISMKFDKNGSTEWQVFEPSNGSTDMTAFQGYIVSDDSGNVYITSRHLGNYNTFTTIKYNQMGEKKWEANHSTIVESLCEPMTLSIDNEGSIYISGSVNEFRNDNQYFLIIKYNSDGQEEWFTSYLEDDHIPVALKTDAAGNVYVTLNRWEYSQGSYEENIVLLKYNRNGLLQWMNNFDISSQGNEFATAMELNINSEIIFSGRTSDQQSSEDYLILKYNKEGNLIWEKRYNGTKNEISWPVELIADNEGNIYILAGARTNQTNNDIAIMKYSREGILDWITYYDKEISWESASDMKMDEFGNIYVCALSFGSGNEESYWITLKFDKNGNKIWAAISDTPTPWSTMPRGIDIDNSGNVYIFGPNFLMSEVNDRDFTLIKYNSNGQEQWLRTFNNSESSVDSPSKIAVDNSGNVYITGWSWRHYDDEYQEIIENLIIKYNTSGKQEWVKKYSNASYEYPLIVVDGWGDLIFSAAFRSEESNYYPTKIVTKKINPDGSEQWSNVFSSSDMGSSYLNDLITDKFGNVYIAAAAYRDATQYDFATIKYSASGEEEWVAFHDAGNSEQAYMIDVDNLGNVYVSGQTYTLNWREIITTIKYNKSGNFRWIMNFKSPGYVHDHLQSLTSSGNGNIYLTLSTSGSGYWALTKILKYAQTEDDFYPTPEPIEYELIQNIPNPFNNQTLILYRLPASSNVSINIYNSLGQLISKEDLGFQSRGEHVFYYTADSNISSGIYYYQLKADQFIDTRKMVLIR
ncbi:MAG: hypothetical protein AMJ53_00105 [Gammaproteobacteria bacterium SG8_11]|nr:MAG: hypothetical protein AMJ53_00105 [Gammaproteobacteria bacterium SG8_11]